MMIGIVFFFLRESSVTVLQYNNTIYMFSQKTYDMGLF